MSQPLDDLMGNVLAEPIANPTPESGDVEVQVVDDRPAEDQVGARDDDRSAPDLEEIEKMGGRAGKRISRLKYEYHEERRNKEAAIRMQEEAIRYAQQMEGQNRELRSVLERGEKVLLSEIHNRTDGDLSAAKERYKKAYESGDADSIADAQEALSRAVHDGQQAEQYQPVVGAQNQQYAQQQMAMQQMNMQRARAAAQAQAQAQAQEMRRQPVDPKLGKWMESNEWFGKDPEKTQFAYGVHERLVNEGLDPRSEEYYQKIDQRMGEVFSDMSGAQGTEGPAVGNRTNVVVAPAARSGGPPRKVQLTSTQVTLAKRLGITPEQYAKQLTREN
jgi:hypothetical protein